MNKTLGGAVADELRRSFEEQAADLGELTRRERFWRRGKKRPPVPEGALTLSVLAERTGYSRDWLKRVLTKEFPMRVTEADVLARNLGSDFVEVAAAAAAASPDRRSSVPPVKTTWADRAFFAFAAVCMVALVAVFVAAIVFYPSDDDGKGRYHELPDCRQLTEPEGVHRELVAAFSPDGPAPQTTRMDRVPSWWEMDDYFNLRCRTSVAWPPGGTEGPAPLVVDADFTLVRDIPQWQEQPAAEAHRQFEDFTSTIKAPKKPEPGVGDEALSWREYTSPQGPYQQFEFRVSNIRASVRLHGGDKNPQALAADGRAIAVAIAEWLKHDWKG